MQFQINYAHKFFCSGLYKSLAVQNIGNRFLKPVNLYKKPFYANKYMENI